MTTEGTTPTTGTKRAKPATVGGSRKSAAKAAITPALDAQLPAPDVTPPTPSKLDQLAALLGAPAGATIDVMITATGWQAHSVRGAMAGALKKRGLTITSDKVDGFRTYRASAAA